MRLVDPIITAGDCQASKIVDLEKVANAASAKSGKLQKSSDQNFKLVNELREANQRMQEQVTQLQAECRTLQIRQPDLLAHVQTLQQQNGEMQRSKDSLQESIDAIVQVVPFGMMSESFMVQAHYAAREWHVVADASFRRQRMRKRLVVLCPVMQRVLCCRMANHRAT